MEDKKQKEKIYTIEEFHEEIGLPLIVAKKLII
jgi:hypothetical protein